MMKLKHQASHLVLGNRSGPSENRRLHEHEESGIWEHVGPEVRPHEAMRMKEDVDEYTIDLSQQSEALNLAAGGSGVRENERDQREGASMEAILQTVDGIPLLLSHHLPAGSPSVFSVPLISSWSNAVPSQMGVRSPSRYESIVCGECGGNFAKESELRDHMIAHIQQRLQMAATGVASAELEPDPSPPPPELEADETVMEPEAAKPKAVRRRPPVNDNRARPYVCDSCGKGFRQRGQLDTHARSHTGERPFSCNQCGKSFRQMAHIQAHLRIHTGERPYKCETCSKSFIQQTHLKNHEKTHLRKGLNVSGAGNEVSEAPSPSQGQQSSSGLIPVPLTSLPLIVIGRQNSGIDWPQCSTKSVSIVPSADP